MTVSLLRANMGRVQGAVAQFGKNMEDSLVAQNLATVALDSATTTGAYTQHTSAGKAAIAAGASSVVITNGLVDANSHVYAVVSQAAADTTLLRVERVVTAAGSFTIFGTANATATTLIDWAIIPAEAHSGS